MKALTQRPVWFALVVVGFVTLVETLFGALLSRFAPNLSILIVGVLTGIVLSLLFAWFVQQLGWWHELGFQKPIALPSLFWFLPFFIYGLLPFAAGIQVAGAGLGLALSFGLAISFWKLTAFGLMLRAFMALGHWRAALTTAFFYGLMHLGSLLVGAHPLPTMLLALSYLLLGFGYAAVQLRTGALWPLMLANALLLTAAAATQVGNAPNLVPTVESILPAVIISALLACYGLFVMPRQPRKHQQTVSAT